MGWTFAHATYYKKNGEVDRKAEIDKTYTWESNDMKVSVVKSQMVGSEYFAAVKVEESDKTSIECVMCLTAGKDPGDPYFNYGYKSIPHTDGYHCPKSIIKLLSEPDCEREAEWRDKCREYQEKAKLKDLPVGSVIRYTHPWNNKEYILEKKAPNYQFKRTWWYNAENNTYMPSRRIPYNWELMKED